MPWSVEGDNIMFNGPVADLMQKIMDPYEADVALCELVDPGMYATATAVVLRSMFMDGLADDAEAAEFVARLDGYIYETDEGVTVETFKLLDDVAENIDPEGLDTLLASDEVRDAIAELAKTGLEDDEACEQPDQEG